MFSFSRLAFVSAAASLGSFAGFSSLKGKCFAFAESDLKPIRTIVDDRPKSIIVIGGTQNGKSTLCNFLYFGRPWENTETRFPMGDGSKSKTKYPLACPVEHVHCDHHPHEVIETHLTFQLLDTPGAGDTEKNEDKNMERFYSELVDLYQKKAVVSGVIICVRFGMLQNEEFERNLKFYRSIFGPLFHQNVMIVITDVREDDKGWKQDKEFNGVSVAKQISDHSEKIKEILGLSYNVPIFAIDAKPFNSKAVSRAQYCRESIFALCRLNELDISKIVFTKTITQQKEDREKILQLTSECDGIQKGIALSNEELAKSTAVLSEISSKVHNAKAKLKCLQEELDVKDSATAYKLSTSDVPYEDTWHCFSLASAPYDFRSEVPIRSKNVTQGWLEEEIDEPLHIKGKIKNDLWRSMKSYLNVFTYYRDWYKDDIIELRSQIVTQKGEVERLEKEQQLNQSRLDWGNLRIAQFNEDLQRSNEEKEKLEGTTIPFEEALRKYSKRRSQVK